MADSSLVKQISLDIVALPWKITYLEFFIQQELHLSLYDSYSPILAIPTN